MSLTLRVTGNTDLKAKLRQKLQVTMLDLHGALKLKSPVDEGTFRDSWTVDTITLTIENNCEYAEPIADGHSPQAAKGWVLDEAKQAFKR